MSPLHEWKSAVFAVTLVFFGELAMIALETLIFALHELVTVRIAHAIVCVGAMGWLVATRKNPRAASTNAAALSAIVPMLYIVWRAQEIRAQLGPPWPFTGAHVGMLIIAATAPGPAWLAFALIGAFAVTSTVQSAMLGARAPAGEPWATIVIAILAVTVQVMRERLAAADRAAAHRRADAEALTRLAEALLAIEDLANTPLQTIALCATLVRTRDPALAPIADRIQRAIERLSELRHVIDARAQGLGLRTGAEGGAPGVAPTLADAPPRGHSPPARAAHVVEDHVGELRVRLDAPDLPALFEEAGRALAEAAGGTGHPGGPPGREEAIDLEASDLEALLVAWLNELIFRGETRREAYPVVHVRDVGPSHLHATVRGVPLSADARTLVKAATYHGLAIGPGPAGVTAKITFDV